MYTGNVIWDYYYPYLLPPYTYSLLVGFATELLAFHFYCRKGIVTSIPLPLFANVTSWIAGGVLITILGLLPFFPHNECSVGGGEFGNDMIRAYAFALGISILIEGFVYSRTALSRPWTISIMANLFSYLAIVLIDQPFEGYLRL